MVFRPLLLGLALVAAGLCAGAARADGLPVVGIDVGNTGVTTPRVRYVTLPYEAHGYAARESNMHVMAETLNWLDKYVKKVPAPAPSR